MEREKDEVTLDVLQTKTRRIESELENERKSLRNYNEIQDNLDSLTKRLNNCYDLFRTSMKGPSVDDELEDMENANITFHKNARNYLENCINATTKKIETFNQEKEELQKKAKALSDQDNYSKEE